MIKTAAAASAIFAMTATTALDAAMPVLQPVPYGSAILRHYQGQPSIELRGRNGAIEIAPLAMDHGCVNFGLAVFNDSARPADIDLSNVSVFVGGAPAQVLTVAELQKRAKNRAFWSAMAVAAVSGLAAGVVAASSSHTTIRTTSPHGVRTTRITYHDGGNSANAALISANGVAMAGAIREKGERHATELGDEILALTTVDPGDSYGGRIVIDKIKAELPQVIMIRVEWNGEVYASKWQLVPEGTPAPIFAPVVSSGSSVPPPIAPSLSQARLEPASITIAEPAEATKAPARMAPSSRPKIYSRDDTVQVPM